jgi:hypothetical protein
MTIPSWAKFEITVRSFASHIWSRPAAPEHIAGVDIDCVLRINAELTILIEITERRDLNKVREDVNKLITAKNYLFSIDHVFARSFCVVDADTVTQGMVDCGAAQNIRVLSIKQFKQMFFSFERYEAARKLHQFGSAVDPLTGEIDELPYVKVQYRMLDSATSLDIKQISDLLIAGKKVVLIGDYGSGKSRCVQELFLHISSSTATQNRYPIAIDLRHNWGLKRLPEIIRRHCDDLGLDDVAPEMLRALQSGAFIFLLDGFDEVGSQAWSTDTDKLRAIRAESLEGVRDLISSHKGGLLISGREHYFNSDLDMFSTLGLQASETTVLYCKEEFDGLELREYFSSLPKQVDLPSWLPRRPLICKTIASLDQEEVGRMFEEEGGDVEFWHHFIRAMCRRDVRIHISLDPDTLFSLLKTLASDTRVKSADVGPLTLAEIQKAFERVVGFTPIEQASVMLQRLPGLGRVKTESDDRQFIDTYILDGLRAVDLIDSAANHSVTLQDAAWRNPLDRLGQRILADGIIGQEKNALQIASRCISAKNKVAASDIIAAMTWLPEEEIDFRNFALDDGSFLMFDMSHSKLKNLRISNTTFNNFIFPNEHPISVFIFNSVIDKSFGLTSAKGIPDWVSDTSIEKFESVQNTSRIKQIGLKPSHEILVTFVKKTFFQKGGGRKEEALLRSMGAVGRSNLPMRVINLLLKEDVFTRFKGDEGWVYNENRKFLPRMDKMLSELNLSNDPIWTAVGLLS